MFFGLMFYLFLINHSGVIKKEIMIKKTRKYCERSTAYRKNPTYRELKHLSTGIP